MTNEQENQLRQIKEIIYSTPDGPFIIDALKTGNDFKVIYNGTGYPSTGVEWLTLYYAYFTNKINLFDPKPISELALKLMFDSIIITNLTTEILDSGMLKYKSKDLFLKKIDDRYSFSYNTDTTFNYNLILESTDTTISLDINIQPLDIDINKAGQSTEINYDDLLLQFTLKNKAKPKDAGYHENVTIANLNKTWLQKRLNLAMWSL